MPRVSVVLIAYNDEKHVAAATRSLCRQTYRDIEILCVDDGSADRTPEIMRQAASEDGRVRVISQPNGGAFSARYAGLQKAVGEYIMFVDSDDILFPEAVETLLREVERTGADVLEFGVELAVDEYCAATEDVLRTMQGLRTNYFSPDRPRPAENSNGALIDACFDKGLIKLCVWNKIYRTSLVREAWQFYRGEHISMGEDLLGTLMILSFARRYARIDTMLYEYRIGSGISTSMKRIATGEDTRLYGMEALLLRLQREWMEKLPQKPENCEAGIAAFRRIVRNDVFNNLLYRCEPSVKAEMMEWIGKCLSPEEFCRELLLYLFDEDRRLSEARQMEEAQRVITEKERQLAQLSREHDVAVRENAELKSQLAAQQRAYDEISSALFWRMTKPARAALDTIKALRRSNKQL